MYLCSYEVKFIAMIFLTGCGDTERATTKDSEARDAAGWRPDSAAPTMAMVRNAGLAPTRRA